MGGGDELLMQGVLGLYGMRMLCEAMRFAAVVDGGTLLTLVGVCVHVCVCVWEGGGLVKMLRWCLG